MIKLFDVTATLFASAPKRGKIDGYCRLFPTMLSWKLLEMGDLLAAHRESDEL